MTARNFQTLVLASTALYGFFLLSGFFEWPPLSPEEYEASSYAFFGAPSFVYHPFVFLAFFGARLIAAFGLIAFFTWGRRLYAIWLALSLAHTAISGIYVGTWFESTLAYILALMDGAILALAYSKQFTELWSVDGQAQPAVPADVARPAGERRG